MLCLTRAINKQAVHVVAVPAADSLSNAVLAKVNGNLDMFHFCIAFFWGEASPYRHEYHSGDFVVCQGLCRGTLQMDPFEGITTLLQDDNILTA